MVVETFGLEHLLLLKRLERRGTLFGVHRMLTRPSSACWRALAACLPVYEPGVRTYVWRENARDGTDAGVIQLSEDRERPEAEVIFITPSLTEHPEVEQLWVRLLSRVCQEAGERGVQRLYAEVPWTGREREVFRQIGFTVYTREDVFRLDRIAPVKAHSLPSHLRRQCSGDKARLLQLYDRITPSRVKWAEGQSSGPSWPMMSHHVTFSGEERYVLVDETDGSLSGALHLIPGATGHWLEVMFDVNSCVQVDGLLDFALERISGWPTRPVYMGVREYQAGILPALHERGFVPHERQARMVKHTTVLIKDSLMKTLPSLEKQVGPSTRTITLLHRETVAEKATVNARSFRE